MNSNKVTFILHKPQLSENIGACARAIKNFNFQKLYLIDPKPIFPNDKILATSVGAKDIIKKSKVFNNLESSLGDIDILIATSARFRNKNVKHINLEGLKKIDFRKKNFSSDNRFFLEIASSIFRTIKTSNWSKTIWPERSSI